MSATIIPVPGTGVTPFFYGDHEVRTVTIDGEPWFVLADLCKALGIARKPAAVAERLDDGVRQTYPIQDSMGRTQQPTLVSEAGMYEVVIRSDKPEATAFRRWVTHEVLPSIRKRGGYLTPEATKAALTDPDFIIRLATSLKEEQARSAALEERVAADAPMARFGRTLAASEGDLLVRQVAAAITAEGVTVSQPKLFGWLRAHGWLCRNRGRLWNAPTQWALEQGFVRQSVTLIATNHGDEERTTPRITTRGQQDLIDGFTSGRYQIEGDAA